MNEKSYEQIREAGVEALEAGRHGEALEAFQTALEVAEAGDDRERIHAARCNVSLALWQAGRPEQAKQGLREIILASREDRTVAAAALWIAAILSKEQAFDKAMQYLSIARERAQAAEDIPFEADAWEGIGNIHLLVGELEASHECYERAVDLVENLEDSRMSWAMKRKNQGYVLALLGRFRESFEALRQARDVAENGPYPWVHALTCQDQAYAYLLRNHLRRAEKAALKAIATSRRRGYLEVMKNAYFILMEVSIRQDSDSKFDIYFEKLQELMPDIRLSKSFFRMFDITDILNLREA